MDYMVVYSSITGNTKKIATEIFSALPGMSKDMQSMAEYRGKDAEIFFIGFWVDRGTCDISVINMLSELQGKKSGAVWHLRPGERSGLLQIHRTEGKGLDSG